MTTYLCRATDGEPIRGPLTARELKTLAAEGWLQPTSLVSPDGHKWYRASKVRGIEFADDDSDVVTLEPVEDLAIVEQAGPLPDGADPQTVPPIAGEPANRPQSPQQQSSASIPGDDPFAFIHDDVPVTAPAAPKPKSKSEVANAFLNALAFVLSVPIGVTGGVVASTVLFPEAGSTLPSGTAVFCCYVAYQSLKSAFGVK